MLAFYTSRYPHSPAADWLGRLQAGQIRLQGQIASGQEILVAGQQLAYHRPPWEEPPVPLGYTVLHEDDQVLVMYSGNFGLGHDVQTFLAAARLLAGDRRIRFAFVGGGARRAEVDRFIREHRLDRCILAPYQPRERLAELLAAGDIHLITMLPSFAGVMVPSKLYGVLAAGRPAIFVGPTAAEPALTVRELGCGAVVEPGDAEGLVRAIRALADDRDRRVRMGEAGRREAASRFGRVPACRAWQDLLSRLSSIEAHA